MWTIDPIDGTKGFLRGDQFAVCVSLIIDADVKVGVIGCPNLPVDEDHPEGRRGCLFVAVKGHGTRQVRPPSSSSVLNLTAYAANSFRLRPNTTSPTHLHTDIQHPSPRIFRVLAFITFYELHHLLEPDNHSPTHSNGQSSQVRRSGTVQERWRYLLEDANWYRV